MMKGMKKIIAMVMAITLAFATTAFAAEAPVPDFNKSLGNSMFGRYERYNYDTGKVNQVSLGINSDDGTYYIGLYEKNNGGNPHESYGGLLTPVLGNVYTTMDDDISMLVVIGDGVLSITVTADPHNKNYNLYDGVYDQISQIDFSKVS